MIFEVHRYAPELNRAYIRGCSVRAPQCKNRKELYSFYDWLPVRKGIHATVSIVYPAPYSESLNKTYRGYVNSRKEGLEFKEKAKTKHSGGMLWNGDTLPDPIITVKFKVIG